MRFKLILRTNTDKAIVPLNYPYAISAVIYRILDSADSLYAAFLHETGYRQDNSLKGFKLFTFSDLITPFRIQGDRMQLLTREAELVVSFHLPQAAENFIKGLFQEQEIVIADKQSRAVFKVMHVEALQLTLTQENLQDVVLKPLSPVVCGLKNEKGNYDFVSPEHAAFIPQLTHNWKEKYKTVYGEEKAEEAFQQSVMEVIFFKNPPKSRLITIKSGTPAETKIRGFVNFKLRVRGKKETLALLLDSGVGVYNGLGMGCLTSEW